MTNADLKIMRRCSLKLKGTEITVTIISYIEHIRYCIICGRGGRAEARECQAV